MDVYDLQAKISLDTAGFVKSIKESVKSIQSIVKEIQGAKVTMGEYTKSNQESEEETEKNTKANKGLSEQLKTANERYAAAKNEVARYSIALNESAKESGLMSDETVDLWGELKNAQAEMDKAGEECYKYRSEISGLKDNSSAAENELKDLAREEKNAGKEAEDSSPKMHKFADALKSGVAVAAKAAAAGITAASAAVTKIVKDSLDATGTFEQLEGGVKKLYGEDWEAVIDNSKKAANTAQMSANEYMQNIMTFSSSLVDSVEGDTEKAADLADKAMRAMADNAATFGNYTAMEQADVLQAISKGNYQTLDNLQLGFAGTKEGMQALIAEANRLAIEQGMVDESMIKTKVDTEALAKAQSKLEKAELALSDKKRALEKAQNNYNKSIENSSKNSDKANEKLKSLETAQDEYNEAVREHGENSDEASKKLKSLEKAQEAYNKAVEKHEDDSGKISDKNSSVEAAQEHYEAKLKEVAALRDAVAELQTGQETVFDMSNFADVVQAIDLIQQSKGIAGTASNEAAGTLEGSVATAKAAWDNFLSGVGDADEFADALMGAIGNISKNLKEIIPRISKGLVTIIKAIAPQIPILLEQILPPVLEGATALLTALAQALPEIIRVLLPSLLQATIDISNAIMQVLPEIFTTLMQVLIENIPILLPAAAQMIVDFVNFILEPDNIQNITDLAIQLLVTLAETLIDSLQIIGDAAPEIIGKLVDAIVYAIPLLVDAAIEILVMLLEYITDDENLDKMLTAGAEIIGALIRGVGNVISELAKIGKDIMQEIADSLGLGEAYQWGVDLVTNFINGIKDWYTKPGGLYDTMEDFGGTIYDYLHHTKPEKGPLKDDDKWGEDFVDNFTVGIKKKRGELNNTLYNIADDISALTSTENARQGGVFSGTSNTAGGSQSVVIQALNVHMNVSSVASDYDVDRMTDRAVEKINEKLKGLQISQQLALGGTGW